MNKQKRKRRIGVLFAICLLVGSLLSSCGKEENQRTPVAHLGSDIIYLEEAVFYTRMLQEQWEYSYDEFASGNMWQEEFGDDQGTFADVLKQDVMDTLVRLHLLCVHAKDYEIELTKEEKEVIEKRAASFMETNTPSVLEAAGATKENVEELLEYNELAAKVASAIQEAYNPEIQEEEAQVGKLSYCLFSTMGTYDAEGNHTPFTEEELVQIQEDAEEFALRARELGDITAAGDEISHTIIDVYFNEMTDGGAHEQVAQAARELELGGVSGLIETEDGYYVVQHVSDYDEEATQENIEALKWSCREEYLDGLLEEWKKETPLVIEEDVWETVLVEEMITE